MKNRCDYCAYIVELQSDRSVRGITDAGFVSLDGVKRHKGKGGRHAHITPAPPAVETVETPNGLRQLCARHARDAVRA